MHVFERSIHKSRVRTRLGCRGTRFFIYFGLDLNVEVINYRTVEGHNTEMALAFIRKALKHGVYFSDYGSRMAHHGFSATHTDADLAGVVVVMEVGFDLLRKKAEFSSNLYQHK